MAAHNEPKSGSKGLAAASPAPSSLGAASPLLSTASPVLRAASPVLRAASAVLLLLLLFVGAPPGTAAAADELTLSITELDLSAYPTGSAVVQVGGETVSQGTFSPEEFEVLVDGEPVPEAEVEATDTEPIPSLTVLLVDESGSMRGPAIDAAATAVRRFANLMRPGDVVGLYAFNEEFRVLQTPTGDAAQVKSAVAQLEPRRETALYDAVAQSLVNLAAIDAEGSRYLIILSDGGDTASETALDEVLTRARSSEVQIYAVGLKGDEFDSTPLRRLAGETGGRYLEAPNPDALTTLYAGLAREIQNQFRLTVPLPEGSSGSGNLMVRIRDGETQAEAERGFLYPVAPANSDKPAREETTEAAATVEPLYVPPLREDGWAEQFVGWNGSDYVVLAFLFIAVLLAGYLLISALVPRRSLLADYSDILENRRRLGPRSVEEEGGRHPGEALAERIVRLRGYEDPLQARIEAAGWQLRTSEFVLFHLIGLLLLVALLLTLQVPLFLAVIIAAVGGMAPLAFLDYKARRRRDAFEDQVPDTLLMMASSFRAGQSFEQAMQVVAAEGPDPTATEFQRVLAQQRLGVSPEVALRSLADRMQSEAFDWVVMATIIQRQVGGNLAEVYEKIAHTLRERVKLSRLVKTLTAEGRLSAIILIALPFVVGALVMMLNPEYLEPLYTTTIGYVMLALALAGMLIGIIWMRRIIRIEG
ncbi:MAG: hypothetical protein Kow00129_14780 [Thermoleophilia bacterium]